MSIGALSTDKVARANRRAWDFEVLRELSAAELPPGVRYYVEQALVWLSDDETKILGGGQRERFEAQLNLLRAGRRLVDLGAVPKKVRRPVRPDQLPQAHGRARKERAQVSVAENAPWMKDASLLPKRPPGRAS